MKHALIEILLGIGVWCLSAILAFIPILMPALIRKGDLGSAFASVYEMDYQNLIIYIVVMAGLGVGDALDLSSRVERLSAINLFSFFSAAYALIAMLALALTVSANATGVAEFRFSPYVLGATLAIVFVIRVCAEMCRALRGV